MPNLCTKETPATFSPGLQYVKDVNQQESIRGLADFLKKSGQLQVPPTGGQA
jgi:hypothetical protein